MSSAFDPEPHFATTVEKARCSWLAASDQASTLAAELFQPGSGYGCPEAEAQDRHRLETARSVGRGVARSAAASAIWSAVSGMAASLKG